MKTVKLSVCLLLVVLSLLSGCNQNAPASTPTGNSTTKPAAQEQRDIYFATGNDYYDLYIGHSMIPGPQIELLSREYIDPETIQVTADMQAKYTVYVTQQETGKSLTTYEIEEEEGNRYINAISRDAYDLPLYLYQTYAGIDWAEVGRLRAAYLSVSEDYKNGKADTNQVNAASAAYTYAKTEYAADYMKLSVEDVPTFYKYLIQVMIDEAAVEETLRTIQITIGEKTYDVDIGQINIRLDPGYSHAEPYLLYAAGSPFWVDCFPYGVGIEKCQSSTYYAEKTVTLTGMGFRENTQSTVQVLDVTVLISDSLYAANDMNAISIPWDGITPILVEQGKYVTMVITVQDDRLREINYHSKLYPILEVTHDGKIYEVSSEIPIIRNYTDAWLLYAIGIGGLDMESYFNDYYYATVSTWRKDVECELWGSQE